MKIIVFPNRLGGAGESPLYSCSQHPSGVSKNNSYQQLPIIGSEKYPYYPPDPYSKPQIIGQNYCQLLVIIVFPNRLGGAGESSILSCSQHPSGVSKNNNFQQLPKIGSENYPYYPPDPYSKT